jgi:hypothetical protein
MALTDDSESAEAPGQIVDIGSWVSGEAPRSSRLRSMCVRHLERREPHDHDHGHRRPRGPRDRLTVVMRIGNG